LTKEEIRNAIENLDYEILIKYESDKWLKQQLIEMYFANMELENDMKNWNGRQWKEFGKKIMRS
jgi:hypothetical protein